ncbi:MAG: hypothetical protein JWO90_256 [Solirubrobacterales bacterium]|jgi:hypothetical protein|nr:hypothetical protein [Solirubrobacterales bacterium]
MSARLEHLLGATPEELAPLLAELTPEQEAVLTEHVADAWHARDAKTLTAVLSLLGVLPDALTAKVVQKRMPARFVARIAPHLPEGPARSLVGRLKPAYLAEVARWVDHPRCRAVLRAIPEPALAEVAVVLQDADDWDTLAAVGRELDGDALAASIGALDPARVRADIATRDAAHRERVEALLP